MNISCGNQNSPEIIHICFNEDDGYFQKIQQEYVLDSGIKEFIEDRYDHVVRVWSRFVRLKTRKENDYFYYSSPILSGLGYPPDYIITLGIIMYIKNNMNKHVILHTQKKDLISYFLNKKFIFADLLSKSVLKAVVFFIHYAFARILLTKVNSPSIVAHSFHNDTFFQGAQYVTSKIPNLEYITKAKSYSFCHDINPNFFSLKNIFKFRKHNCIYSPQYLNLLSIFGLYFLSAYYLIKSKVLFRCFYFSTTNHYSKIFFELLKRKSIAQLMQKMPPDSYYIMPWENRGYQLGIEKALKGKKLINYSCGLLSKVSTEYVNYRYIRHHDFALHIAMSKKVKEFLLRINSKLKVDIVKSPRVFELKLPKQKQNKKSPEIIVICPIEQAITRRMIQLFLHQTQYSVKFKFHPYCPVAIAKEKIEQRPLSDCLADYLVAIYEGFTTASMEAYLSGLSVYRLCNPNRISFDTMSDIAIKTIKDLNEIDAYQRSISESLVNDYLGVSEIKFNQYMEKLLGTK